MEIYIADIRALANEQVFKKACNLLPDARRERIEKLHKFEDKLRGTGAYLLLEYGLLKRGYTLRDDVSGRAKVWVETATYGKPYLKGIEDLHFNLSHSGNYVAAVFAEDEAGIDLEHIRPARAAFVHRFFSAEECTYLQALCEDAGAGETFDKAFTRLWTRKESYIKAVGEGMHLPLADFSVLSDTVTGDATYHIRTWENLEEIVISVCAKKEIEAEIVTVDLKKMI